jgi:hypothetical protein
MHMYIPGRTSIYIIYTYICMSRFTCGQPAYMYIHLQTHSLVSFISSGRTPWHCVDSPTSDGLAHDRRKDHMVQGVVSDHMVGHPSGRAKWRDLLKNIQAINKTVRTVAIRTVPVMLPIASRRDPAPARARRRIARELQNPMCHFPLFRQSQ